MTPGPSAAPSATPLPIAGIVDDPALAGQISAIIAHPASAERPFLRHFLVGDAKAGTGTDTPSSASGRPSIWALLAMLEVVGLSATLLALRRRSRRTRELTTRATIIRHPHAIWTPHAWRRSAALIGLAAPVALFITLGVSSAGSVLRTAKALPVPTHPASATAARAGTVTTAASAAATPSPTWVELVSIEQRLDLQHQALIAQETTVTTLTHRLEATATPPPASPPAAGSPSPAAVDLARIVDLHQATMLAYQQTLEHEYQVFATAAADPAQRAELLASASAIGPAGAPDAVAYDLAAVQAQMTQDSAISAAEALAQAQATAADPSGKAQTGDRPSLSPPLGGELTLAFGPTDLPFEAPATHDGTFYPHFHTGLDISAPFDTPVQAAADGTVILGAASTDSQGRLVGYGNYVAIAHPGGLTTVYAHLDSMAVKAGQAVHKGDVIGLEGTSGNSTGPHVHFETRISGGIVDPAPYLAGQIKRP